MIPGITYPSCYKANFFENHAAFYSPGFVLLGLHYECSAVKKWLKVNKSAPNRGVFVW